MHIERFVCNPFQENCYIVSDDSGEAVIIDCGAFYEEERRAVVDYIRGNNLQVKHLVATHGHIDHNFGNDTVEAEFDLRPIVHRDDETFMNRLYEQARYFAGIDIDKEHYHVGEYVDGDKVIEFGNHKLTLIPTPGHTPGSVFLYCEAEKVAFSGDTLFRNSIGRTDLELGSYDAIISSLHKVMIMLPDDTLVLPGHGQQTTIGDEKATNPYIR